jgi:predicted methyltransferase
MNKFVFDPSIKFLNPEKLLFQAGLTAGQTVADLGTGGGFYSLSAGKIVGEQGVVYSVDVLETALDHVSAEGRLKGVRNIKTVRADLERENSCTSILTGSVDLVIAANITHQIKNQKILFAEAYRLLKTGGKLVFVEWSDQPSTFGPAAADRIKPEAAKALAKQTALKEAGVLETDNYHYGLLFIK